MKIEDARKLLEDNGYSVEDMETFKNGNLINGLSVSRKDEETKRERIQPFIHNNTLLEINENDLLDMVSRAFESIPTKSIYDSIDLNNCYVCLQRRCNEDEKIIKKEFLDMDAYIRVDVEGFGSAKLTKELVNMLNPDMTENKLFEIALKNTQNRASLNTFLGALIEFGIDVDTSEILDEQFILTSNNKIYGASSMMCNEMLEKICDIINADEIAIIPSSIHEVIVMKFNDEEVDYAKHTIKEVNDTVVDENDLLSYSLYKYSKSSGKIVII